MAGPIILDAYSARSCAVKTQNAYDPTITLLPGPVDEALQDAFEGGIAFENEVLDRLVAECEGPVVDLRLLAGDSWPARVEACRAAMASGAAVIIAGALPRDLPGHRTGLADLWVRGADQPDGRPGYLPVEVKWHKVQEAARTEPFVTKSSLRKPAPTAAEPVAGKRFRYGLREADLLQVAHYWRLLQAAGWAAGTPETEGGSAFGGVIGTDQIDGELAITWADLGRPVIRTFSRSAESGYALRSVLQRYDHEHDFRVLVARTASRQDEDRPPPLRVQPIVIDECNRCVWFEHCRTRLADDDLSLRIDKGPLDIREIGVLRQLGVNTITDLVDVDLDELLPKYLTEVTHRPTALDRLNTARHRAIMIVRGLEVDRITQGPIDMPSGTSEIDFDLEASDNRRIYLWGFLVNKMGAEPEYVDFTAWRDLDADGELGLAKQALGWFKEQVEAGGVVGFHYSGYEYAQVLRLSEEHSDPLLDWAVAHWEDLFCDLYGVVKEHYFGAHGLGLKQIATIGAGFAWRDADPGGLNSQGWFYEAVHADSARARAQARRRVLEYNEDDVRATLALRSWLRSAR